MQPTMELEPTRAAAAHPSWRTAATPNVLAAIREPLINLTCWERTLPTGLEDALVDAVPERESFERIPVAAVHPVFLAILAAVAAPARDWLLADLGNLVRTFADIAAVTRVTISFGGVVTDACRKFHVDHHALRLITTYAGPGTEWLPNEAVNRAAMGHPDDCPCDSNESIVRAGASARRANAGDVLLMRGASKGGALGLVHRSPPIEALGLRRVVLVLSTVERT